MKGFDYNQVVISGISCVLPEVRKETRDYIGVFEEKDIEKFIETTGIKQRYLSNGKQTASDLCCVAAKRLMEHKGLTGEDIDALIFITQDPDYKVPSTAFTLHKRLGIQKECLTFDVNVGCSGFTVGLTFLGGLIQGGLVNRALLLIGDAMLYPPQNDDLTDSLMFGAAGTATLLEKGEGRMYGANMSDGTGYNVIMAPIPGARFPDMVHPKGTPDTYMINDDTFLFTITQVPKLFKEFFKKYECSMDDFDYCMLHQPNLMILKQIAKRVKIADEKLHVSLDKYGNTDGATIPLGIADLCQELNEERTLKLICSGFGVGLSWAVVAFDLNTCDVLPIISTDEYWEEGFEAIKCMGAMEPKE
ncbi:MAG: ketoacyl-ACP synthase III [Lachnospiraceae bacterium]|nr:ketoacyl-ACP synthase III [Lachnospiraceae bacterium]